MPAAHLELREVSFRYPAWDSPASAPGRPVSGRAVLDDVSWSVQRGAFVVLRGPSGMGKSTLLRLLCRLEEPDAGQILLDGQAITELEPTRLRCRVAYLQQMPTVLPGSLRENLLLPYGFAANRALIPPGDGDLARRLEHVGLPPDLDAQAETLSVGQRQRLCFVRALLLEPEVLLLDEPTASLDPDSAGVVIATAAAARAAGTTVIMVSHAGETPPVPDPTLVRMQNGKLETVTPAEVAS